MKITTFFFLHGNALPDDKPSDVELKTLLLLDLPASFAFSSSRNSTTNMQKLGRHTTVGSVCACVCVCVGERVFMQIHGRTPARVFATVSQITYMRQKSKWIIVKDQRVPISTHFYHETLRFVCVYVCVCVCECVCVCFG